MSHSNAAIRQWLRDYGPASCGDYIRAHGLTGTEAERIGQRMAGMFKDGVLTRTGRGGCGHPFVYAASRDVLTKQEAMQVALAAKRARFLAEGPKPRKSRAKAPPKPKPPKVRTPAQRRIKEDGAFLPAAITKAQPVKAELPDTTAWIAANPDKLIRLEVGATSQPRLTLSWRERKAIEGIAA